MTLPRDSNNGSDFALESQVWLVWLETPEGQQAMAGFDYFLFLLNDSRDEAERQRARESLQRVVALCPRGRFNDAMSETYIYMAEQRML